MHTICPEVEDGETTHCPSKNQYPIPHLQCPALMQEKWQYPNILQLICTYVSETFAYNC